MNRYLHPESCPKLFTPWQDPVSGVTSYILTERVGTFQQGPYFTSPNVGAEGRYVWHYASFPPNDRKMLAVVDMAEQKVTFCPEAGFRSEVWVDDRSGEVFFATRTDIWRRGPRPGDRPVRVGRLPDEVGAKRYVDHITSHLVPNADRTLFNLDIRCGYHWYIGTMHIDTGKVDIWDEFDWHANHSQFNPTDPKLMMFAQDWWYDTKTGEYHQYKNRIWLIREGEKARPLYAEPSERTFRQCHEWWAADGKAIWYMDYDLGTFRYDLATAQAELIWPSGTCHSHCSADERYVCGDIGAYGYRTEPACRIAFYNRATGKEIDIVSKWPFHAWHNEYRWMYHGDPHPQFVCGDEFISYSTSVLGQMDFALVRVADLVKLTQ